MSERSINLKDQFCLTYDSQKVLVKVTNYESFYGDLPHYTEVAKFQFFVKGRKIGEASLRNNAVAQQTQLFVYQCKELRMAKLSLDYLQTHNNQLYQMCTFNTASIISQLKQPYPDDVINQYIQRVKASVAKNWSNEKQDTQDKQKGQERGKAKAKGVNRIRKRKVAGGGRGRQAKQTKSKR